MSDNKSQSCNSPRELAESGPNQAIYRLCPHTKVCSEPTSVLSRDPRAALALEVLANSAHLLMRRSKNLLALSMIMLMGMWLVVPANATVTHRKPTHGHATTAIAEPHPARAHSAARKTGAHSQARSASAKSGHTPTRNHLASAKAASRHGRRHKLAPQEAQVNDTIPAVPLRHAKFALPAPMRGSRESLVRQNVLADSEGLERIENDEDLERMIHEKDLVAVPTSGALRVNESLPVNRRYCRPWSPARTAWDRGPWRLWCL